VVEQGSHDELMRAHGGVYRRLVELEDVASRVGIDA
jgi:ABC-type multidrug transport system fused ATPase/permease subunit